MLLRSIGLTLVTMAFISPSTWAKNDKNKSKSKSLPPGLQKKQQEGKPLPPGWQKKLAKGDILDQNIYDRGRVVLPVDKKGIISIEVEGTVLKLYKNTREIIEILKR